MGFDKSKIQFLNFCPRHGYDIHDGTKNECCQEGSVIPMLNKDGLEALNEKGIDTYLEDFTRMRSLYESNPEKAGEVISNWVRKAIIDLSAYSKKVKEALSAEEVPGEVEETEEEENGDFGNIHEVAAHNNLIGYMEGFKAGVVEGYKAALEQFRSKK